MFSCPVCGYNKLRHPAEEGTICPSCYTEYGYDDATRTYGELRQEWLSNGPKWEGANVMAAPYGWNPYEQLKNIGVIQETQNTPTEEPRIEIVDLGRHSHQVEIIGGVATIMGHSYAFGRAVASVTTPTARAVARA